MYFSSPKPDCKSFHFDEFRLIYQSVFIEFVFLNPSKINEFQLLNSHSFSLIQLEHLVSANINARSFGMATIQTLSRNISHPILDSFARFPQTLCSEAPFLVLLKHNIMYIIIINYSRIRASQAKTNRSVLLFSINLSSTLFHTNSLSICTHRWLHTKLNVLYREFA